MVSAATTLPGCGPLIVGDLYVILMIVIHIFFFSGLCKLKL